MVSKVTKAVGTAASLECRGRTTFTVVNPMTQISLQELYCTQMNFESSRYLNKPRLHQANEADTEGPSVTSLWPKVRKKDDLLLSKGLGVAGLPWRWMVLEAKQFILC
jgi:hypothetical protein